MNDLMIKNVVDGVIKFRADHKLFPCAECQSYGSLERWRQVFWRLKLIGQNDNLYGGAGYGNISHRIQGARFLISGSQTGAQPNLYADGYACVDDVFFAENAVTSRGEVLPSSESMTHAAVYVANPAISMVLHVHSPLIWAHYSALGVSTIAADIGYGTLAMAEAIRVEVKRLSARGQNHGEIVMLGHEDGVIAWGETAELASMRMLDLYTRATRLKMQEKFVKPR